MYILYKINKLFKLLLTYAATTLDFLKPRNEQTTSVSVLNCIKLAGTCTSVLLSKFGHWTVLLSSGYTETNKIGLNLIPLSSNKEHGLSDDKPEIASLVMMQEEVDIMIYQLLI